MNRFIQDDTFENFIEKIASMKQIDKASIKEELKKTYKLISHSDLSVANDITLYSRWMDSLELDAPDYSVYSNDLYIAEAWACWYYYSKAYLKNINNKNSLYTKSIVEDLRNIDTVLDLGNGFGYTTAFLKELFPTAIVYGLNLKESFQYEFSKNYCNYYGYNQISSLEDFPKGKNTLVFASEFFEHLKDPVQYLDNLIQEVNPYSFIIANAFGAKAIGHFDTYLSNGESISSKDISKVFNKFIKTQGYTKSKTKLWNQRPSFYKRNDNKSFFNGEFDE